MWRIILASLLIVLITIPVLGNEIIIPDELVDAYPGENELIVNWMTIDTTTHEPIAADSQVEYGPTEALGFSSEIDTTLKPTHRMIVPMEIKDGDIVYYRVKSKDTQGSIYISQVKKIVIDLTAPQVRIKTLVDGQVVKGIVPIEIEANDDKGLEYVQIDIEIDGSLPNVHSLAKKLPPDLEDTKEFHSPPYIYNWDTTKCPDTRYIVEATASDIYKSVHQRIKVTVDNIPPDTTPPVVRIISPVDGQVISGDVDIKITIDVTDDQEMHPGSVYCFINNKYGQEVAKLYFGMNPPYESEWAPSFKWMKKGLYEYTLQAEAKDREGNVGKSSIIRVKVASPGTDITPPVTQDNYQFNDIWTNQDANITLTATDDITGVKETHYTINGTEYTGTGIIIIQEGIHTVQYWSIDNGGNVESKHTITVKIDKTPPTVVIYTDPTEDIWPPDNKTVTVTVRGSATDELSGVSSKIFTVTDEYNEISPTLSDFNQTVELLAARRGDDLDGRVYTIKVDVTDNTGNSSSGQTTVIVPHDRRK